MAHDHGRFVWFENITGDAEQAQRFYGELFGWRIEPVDMGGGMLYPMLHVGEQAFGGIAPPANEGVPTHWVSYLSVPDVDAAAKRVAALGGRTLMDAFDIPNVGRMQPVGDPQGAVFVLFRAGQGDPTPTEGDGAFHWNELLTPDPEAAVRFYGELVGHRHEIMPMPGGDYRILLNGDTPRGGVAADTGGERTASARWLQYFRVPDADAALDRTRRLGGRVVSGPVDVPGVGRIATIADPGGATVGLITPTR